MNSTLAIDAPELTLQDFLSQGAAKLAERRAAQAAVDAKALAAERAEFETAWGDVVRAITDRWPFVAVDKPVFIKDDGTHSRLPQGVVELSLRLPAELAPINVRLEKRFVEVDKEKRWLLYDRAIQVHELRVQGSYGDGGYYVSSHEIDETFYPTDFDAALAYAAETGARRPELEAECVQLNAAQKARNVARHEKQAALPTDAERALALFRELVDLVHTHEQES